MTYIVFKNNNEVVFSGDTLPTFDDATLVVTENLETYEVEYDYSLVNGEAVKGEAREFVEPPPIPE